MKETIEAWARCSGSRVQVYACEVDARKDALTVGGTVVKLTGEMPRQLRKVSTEVWIKPCEVESTVTLLCPRLGISDYRREKDDKCFIRARITMEELSE